MNIRTNPATFTPADAPLGADVPEWRMTSAQWIAHQERLHGQDWRAEIDRMDGEAADSAFYGCVGSEAFDAAPDLTPRSVAGMTGAGL